MCQGRAEPSQGEGARSRAVGAPNWAAGRPTGPREGLQSPRGTGLGAAARANELLSKVVSSGGN